MGRDLVDVVMEAVAGGVSIVQIREKSSETKAFYDMARALKSRLSKTQTPLIINDRVDVALAVDAEGVHVGQSDLPCHIVRTMLGPDKIVGVSINTYEQIKEAEQQGATYLSLSPVYPTSTKTDTTEPFGLSGLQAARKMTQKPLITIGGINQSNIREIMSTGMDGVALVSAICSAPSPKEAAAELSGLISEVRK